MIVAGASNLLTEIASNPNLLAAVAITFVIGLACNKLGILYADRLGLFSMPSARRRHEFPIPVTGGLWIYFSFMLGLLSYVLLEPSGFMAHYASVWRVLFGMSALTILGYFDDRKILLVKHKFAAQLMVCAFALTIPEVQRFCEAFQPIFGYLIYPLILIFMIGITNAVNFIDGADGLLATTLLIFFSGNLLRLSLSSQVSVAPLMILLLIPAVSSFLVFNWRPAKIFMGDTGSLALGFILVVTCLSIPPGTGDWHGEFKEALGGAIQFGYPIIDLIWVITKRLRRGFSPFRADQNHLHHCLMRFGFSVSGCVFVLGLLNACLQLTAFQVLNRPLEQTWPLVIVTGSLGLLLLTWIITVDRWKNRELTQGMSLTPVRPRAVPDTIVPQNFALTVNTQPLFEGQKFGRADQALSSIQSLGFMLESNCPKGTQVLWQPGPQVICVLFPADSVAPQDERGIVVRIQQLINNWIEMFNVSLSAPSLRVTVRSAFDLVTQENPQTLRLAVRRNPEDSAA